MNFVADSLQIAQPAISIQLLIVTEDSGWRGACSATQSFKTLPSNIVAIHDEVAFRHLFLIVIPAEAGI
jgi:hypothetical protein